MHAVVHVPVLQKVRSIPEYLIVHACLILIMHYAGACIHACSCSFLHSTNILQHPFDLPCRGIQEVGLHDSFLHAGTLCVCRCYSWCMHVYTSVYMFIIYMFAGGRCTLHHKCILSSKLSPRYIILVCKVGKAATYRSVSAE